MPSQKRIKEEIQNLKHQKLGDLSDLWDMLENFEAKENFFGFTTNGPHGMIEDIDRIMELLTDQIENENWACLWVFEDSGDEDNYDMFERIIGLMRTEEEKIHKLKEKTSKLEIDKVYENL